MKLLGIALLVSIPAIASQGNQGLSRATAAALIQKHAWMHAKPTFTFAEGRQCVGVDRMQRRMGPYYVKLQNLNLGSEFLTYRNLEPKDWKSDRDYFRDQVRCSQGIGDWIVVTLTAKGREAAPRWRRNGDGSYSVSLGSRTFGEITGITDGEKGLKVAEFAYSWKAGTDVGDAFFLERKGVQNASASFRLYDDGWRLVSIHDPSGADIGADDDRPLVVGAVDSSSNATPSPSEPSAVGSGASPFIGTWKGVATDSSGPASLTLTINAGSNTTLQGIFDSTDEKSGLRMNVPFTASFSPQTLTFDIVVPKGTELKKAGVLARGRALACDHHIKGALTLGGGGDLDGTYEAFNCKASVKDGRMRLSKSSK